jgi:uncharacterized protein involved in exopolysaccharide biosynthesis
MTNEDSPTRNNLSVLRTIVTNGRVLAIFAAVGLVGGVLHAILASKVYRSEVIVVPAQAEASGFDLSGLGLDLPGLAGLAGLAGLGSDEIGTDESLAVLRSRSFTQDFIERHELVEPINRGRWNRLPISFGSTDDRDVWDAYLFFDRQIRHVVRDTKAGVIRIQIDWVDREEGARWANELVADLNRERREAAIRESSASLKYLRDQLSETDEIAIRTAIYKLVEKQQQRLMLANVRPEFAFRVLDHALAPDETYYVAPRRVLIVLTWIVGSLAIAVILFYLRASSDSRSPRL